MSEFVQGYQGYRDVSRLSISSAAILRINLRNFSLATLLRLPDAVVRRYDLSLLKDKAGSAIAKSDLPWVVC